MRHATASRAPCAECLLLTSCARYVTGLRGAPTAKMVVVDLELDVGLKEPTAAEQMGRSTAPGGRGVGASGNQQSRGGPRSSR